MNRKRGIYSVADLKARCTVTPTGCWLWTGAQSNGQPRVWTFDHAVGEKRPMPGTRAAWNLAHDEAPRPGWLVFHRCGVRLCLCPVHLGQAPDLASIGLHTRRSGARKGLNMEQQRANAQKAWQARGLRILSDETVRGIRQFQGTCTAAAATFGVLISVASKIRRGQSYRHVPQEATP